MDNQQLTKKDLEEIMDKKIDDLATKVILPSFEAMDKRMNSLDKRMISLDTKIDQVKSDLQDDIREFKDQVLTREDETIGELKIIREELLMHTASYQQLNERVGYLETVVKVLAEKIGIRLQPATA
jgi:hypothetical protein